MSPGAPLSLSLVRSHYRDPPIPESSETRNDILPSLAVTKPCSVSKERLCGSEAIYGEVLPAWLPSGLEGALGQGGSAFSRQASVVYPPRRS